MDRLPIYLTVLVYFAFLLVTGWRFRSLNRNLGDFVRGGGMGTWWLVGVSLVISNVSAMTFTGMGSMAFEAGPVPLIAYGATAFGNFVCFLCLAAWIRRTDAYTVPDILRERFGPEVEQFNSYYSFIWGIQNGAIWLWALSIFCSAMFDLPSNLLIVVLGVIVAAYSIMGGRWAVMGTDFLQSLIILPVTIIVFVLSLKAVGGVGSFLEHWGRMVEAGDYALLKKGGSVASDKYTLAYIAALVVNTLVFHLSFITGNKFLSAKNGKVARQAALFGSIAVIVGAVMWVTPAVVARFIYEDQVLAHVEIANPADTAYAVAAGNVLPAGLAGLMVVVLFAATMSNMDTGLNTTAGIFVRNIIRPLRRKFGRTSAMSPESEVRSGQLVTAVNGTVMILLALLFANASAVGILEFAYTANVLIAFPMAVPILVGTWIKRLPRWSYFFSFGCALVPAIGSVISGSLLDQPWSLQTKTFSVLGVGIAAMLVTIPFYGRSPVAFRNRVEEFFRRIRTDADEALVESEESKRVGLLQKRILGSTCLWAALVVLALLLVPSDLSGRIGIFFISGVLATVGLALSLRKTSVGS